MAEATNRHVFKAMASPVGTLTLVASERGLAAVLWSDDKPSRVRLPAMVNDESAPILRQAEAQLLEYFAGRRKTFTVPLDFVGTAFQRKVWHAMFDIPFGETRTYGQLANQIGNAKAVRAVGAASSRNPISIIGPCHRVIGSTGKLTGFAGGLRAKQFLLALESKQAL